MTKSQTVWANENNAMSNMRIIAPQKGPQERFLRTSADICIYGGAAGGGKTFAILLEILRHVNDRQFGAVVFRKNYNQIMNEGGLLDTSRELYSRIPGTKLQMTPKSVWRFKSGAKVSFEHLNNDTSVLAMQGAQIALICFDELTHFSRYQFFYMLSRNRSISNVKPYIRATCNPDSDSWVAEFIEWWIDQSTGYPIPERSGVLRYMVRISDKIIWGNSVEELVAQGIEKNDIKSVTFIASSLEDNKILMERDPSYLANLKALPEVERERLWKGNWKIRPQAGMYFRRADFHIIREEEIPKNVIRWCRAWDIAATEPTEGVDPDATSGTLMGITEDSKIVVAGRINVKIAAGAVENLIVNTAITDRARYGFMYTVHVPQDPGAAGKIVAQRWVTLLQGFDVRSDPVSGSKIQRALPFAAQCQHGNVYIVEGAWNDSYLNELEGFPDIKHDDDVDSSSDAYNTLAGDGFNIRGLL